MVQVRTFVCVLLVVLSSLAAIEARRSHAHALTQAKSIHRTEDDWDRLKSAGGNPHCQRYKHVGGCIFGYSAATCEENPFNPCPMGHKCTCQPREQDYMPKRLWKAVTEYMADANYCNCVQRSCVEWAPGECVIESPQSMVVNNFWSAPPAGHGCAFVDGRCQIVACSPKQIEQKVVGFLPNGLLKETFNCATDPSFWTDMTVEKRKELSQQLHGSRFTPVLELIQQRSLHTQTTTGTETGVGSGPETIVEPAPEFLSRELGTEAVGKSATVSPVVSAEVDTCAAAEQFFVETYKRWPVFAKAVASESLLNRFSSLQTPTAIPVYSGHATVETVSHQPVPATTIAQKKVKSEDEEDEEEEDPELRKLVSPSVTVAQQKKKEKEKTEEEEEVVGGETAKAKHAQTHQTTGVKSDLRDLGEDELDPLNAKGAKGQKEKTTTGGENPDGGSRVTHHGGQTQKASTTAATTLPTKQHVTTFEEEAEDDEEIVPESLKAKPPVVASKQPLVPIEMDVLTGKAKDNEEFDEAD